MKDYVIIMETYYDFQDNEIEIMGFKDSEEEANDFVKELREKYSFLYSNFYIYKK